jgi:hypothetical protein
MSRFTQELRVIPKAAWIVAGLVNLCFTLPLFLFVAPTDREIGKWPRWGQALCVCAMFLFVAAADAVRNVDAAGDLRSSWDWDNLVLHSPRPFAEGVPQLRAYRKGRVSILSALQHFAAANVPEM